MEEILKVIDTFILLRTLLQAVLMTFDPSSCVKNTVINTDSSLVLMGYKCIKIYLS